MEDWEELRIRLIRFIKSKFYSRPQVAEMAEDIVNDAIADIFPNSAKCNFGYLSKVCTHKAYRLFKQLDYENKSFQTIYAAYDLIDESDVVEEILQNEDAAEILSSLEVLKQMERIVVVQRYYGDFSFSEIAKRNNIKLNTVLSHHRRALEKLRSHLIMADPDKTVRKDKLRIDQDRNFSNLF